MTPRPRKILKIALVSVAAVVLLAVAGFLIWTQAASYPAFPAATDLANSADTSHGWIAFPSGDSTVGLIFYPGALVAPAAYAPLMEQVSTHGITTVITPMPLGLAIFGIGTADGVIAAYPNIKHWIIAGHSLGGSMAAEYVKQHPDKVQGLVFLASYSADSTDLSKMGLRALSIYGTKDGLAASKVPGSMVRLPPDARLLKIDGGNHAQFGDYGPQKGDGVATIGRAQQQALTATAIGELADSLR